jgi:hypothetical protein
MSIVRITRFTANTPDTDGMLAKRAELIATVRAAFPGPTATTLTRAADDTWTDAWTWESEADANAAGAARLPMAAEAFALVTIKSTADVELIDAS